MPEIGPLEILVIAVVALIVFGPEKLPEMGRKVGHFVANMRRMSTEMRSEFTGWMDDEDDDPFTPDDEKTTAASRADDEERASEDGSESDGKPAAADEAPTPRARVEG